MGYHQSRAQEIVSTILYLVSNISHTHHYSTLQRGGRGGEGRRGGGEGRRGGGEGREGEGRGGEGEGRGEGGRGGEGGGGGGGEGRGGEGLSYKLHTIYKQLCMTLCFLQVILCIPLRVLSNPCALGAFFSVVE